MKRSTRSALKVGKWLIFPLYLPFVRTARALTQSRQYLRDRKAFIEASAIDTTLAPVMNPATIRALVSTRRYGRLCLLLLMSTLGVWGLVVRSSGDQAVQSHQCAVCGHITRAAG